MIARPYITVQINTIAFYNNFGISICIYIKKIKEKVMKNDL